MAGARTPHEVVTGFLFLAWAEPAFACSCRVGATSPTIYRDWLRGEGYLKAEASEAEIAEAVGWAIELLGDSWEIVRRAFSSPRDRRPRCRRRPRSERNASGSHRAGEKCWRAGSMPSPPTASTAGSAALI